MELVTRSNRLDEMEEGMKKKRENNAFEGIMK